LRKWKIGRMRESFGGLLGVQRMKHTSCLLIKIIFATVLAFSLGLGTQAARAQVGITIFTVGPVGVATSILLPIAQEQSLFAKYGVEARVAPPTRTAAGPKPRQRPRQAHLGHVDRGSHPPPARRPHGGRTSWQFAGDSRPFLRFEWCREPDSIASTRSRRYRRGVKRHGRLSSSAIALVPRTGRCSRPKLPRTLVTERRRGPQTS